MKLQINFPSKWKLKINLYQKFANNLFSKKIKHHALRSHRYNIH
uniref:Uncharacterized protein n=1 Tax=Arundo donax TaxID=35708 RepID=A0A0A8ZYB5_ARUDO